MNFRFEHAWCGTSFRTLLGTGCGAALLALVSAGIPSAHAQPVERFIPERPDAEAVEISPDLTIPRDVDDTQFGVDLKALAFIGAEDDLLSSPGDDVVSSKVPILDDPAFRAEVSQFIGQPLSLDLIARIEVAVTRFFRDQNRPFVSVVTPPQEISEGFLQLRVVTFRAGQIRSTGGARIGESQVLRGVRLQSGDEIDAKLLSEDLRWLNRNPFRRLESIFSPGEALGETDLDLRVTEGRPWRLSTGYTNSGTVGGRDRYSAGITFADFPIPGLLASYQLTTSRDLFRSPPAIRADRRKNWPAFTSHGGFVALPIGARQELELIGSYVATRENAQQFFDIDRRTIEGRFAYRSAMSNFSNLPGDLMLGIEARRQERDVYFARTRLSNPSIDIFQGVIGWANQQDWQFGRLSIDAKAHFSPGGVTNRNSDRSFADFTTNRVRSARYAYIGLDFEHTLSLPHDFSLVTSGRARFASQALPDTEQLSLVGANAVRGYASSQQGLDSGIYTRNELRLPVITAGSAGVLAPALQPFVFFDGGHGKARGANRPVTVSSVGAGLDFAVGSNLEGGVDVGYALRAAGNSKRGETQVNFRVNARF